MLTHLSIKNYALIEALSIDFSSGLSIITGETGAGKSILLGALGLALGNRADTQSLKDGEKKCIIEASFDIDSYKLQDFFEEEDLDYESTTILRREILPSGKSRAFVNDTPVNLSSLQALKLQLMDIHSQHQTLSISDNVFQFSLIDALANTKSKVASYKRGLQEYQKVKKELESFKLQQESANQQHEYNVHLYKELEEAEILADEQENLEERLEKMNNVEEIKLILSEALQITLDEQMGVQNMMHTLQTRLQKIAGYSKEYEELSNRLTSLKIELDDIAGELETANENVEYSPVELERLNDRLQLLYTLQKKHQVASNEELLQAFDELALKVEAVENADEILHQKQLELDKITSKLDDLAQIISKERKQVLPTLKSSLESLLSDVGMTNAQFSIDVELTNDYHSNGKDKLTFLFSANKGVSFGELKKVASGGELSRIMLAIKKVLSENSQLPTIIFDEIDTGVSGEISNRMASIMKEMSRHMQVITITHLPQVAAKGDQHYKVFKEEVNQTTVSSLKALNPEERIVEIAEMLGGKQISDSALTHAKELLN